MSSLWWIQQITSCALSSQHCIGPGVTLIAGTNMQGHAWLGSTAPQQLKAGPAGNCSLAVCCAAQTGLALHAALDCQQPESRSTSTKMDGRLHLSRGLLLLLRCREVCMHGRGCRQCHTCSPVSMAQQWRHLQLGSRLLLLSGQGGTLARLVLHNQHLAAVGHLQLVADAAHPPALQTLASAVCQPGCWQTLCVLHLNDHERRALSCPGSIGQS